MKYISKLLISASILSTSLITGCTNDRNIIAEETAARLSAPANLVKRIINTEIAPITSFEKQHEKGAPIHVYIGSKVTQIPSNDIDIAKEAFRNNPVALHLATRDLASNVIALARECEFQNTPCPDTPGEETILLYDQTLNNIASRHGNNGFHLVGFNNGAAIAVLLGSKRNDIRSIRTVSGNLNQSYGEMYNVADHATRIKTIPQHHFSGEADSPKQERRIENFFNTIGFSNCIKYSVVAGANQADGWVSNWPDLLELGVPSCEFEKQQTPSDFITTPKSAPIFVPRMAPNK